ncbi:MAG: hypothetical protein R6V72_19540 [Cyclobacterium sp.]|uniref:hypothetical protein n=1 Tax=Cyclobacterium sp. TaxID=1966343 RepID=UPI003970AAB1
MFLRSFVFSFFTLFAAHAQEDPNFDMSASEVYLDAEKEGFREFKFTIKNLGKSTAPAGSYRVFFKVNGKMQSFEIETSALEAGKSLIYTSGEKIPANQPGKKLKYRLIIHTKDADKSNNQLKGEIIL